MSLTTPLALRRLHRNFRSALKRAAAKLFDLVFPLSCLGCASEGAWLCADCEKGLAVILANHCPFCETKTPFGSVCAACAPRRALDGAVSCVPYAHPAMQALIHAWKYNSVAAVTPYLARFAERSLLAARREVSAAAKQSLAHGISARDLRELARAPALLSDVPVWLEPIPLHPKREKERGYNQSLLLADALARSSKTMRLGRTLSRTKKTAAQATLSGIDRRTNIAGAFAALDPASAAGRHIVLVDDVITTGSTTDALARLLKNSGALSVWALTLAYGHPMHD